MVQMAPAQDSLKLGLRFERKSVPRLRQLADDYQGQPGIDTSLYIAAADSAERDDPLEVNCSTKAEAEQMADLFVVLGVNRPAIDELNG